MKAYKMKYNIQQITVTGKIGSYINSTMMDRWMKGYMNIWMDCVTDVWKDRQMNCSVDG